jgi:hypothetical protein
MISSRSWVLVAISVTIAACASTGGAAGGREHEVAVSRPDRNVITADELASVPESDLYAAVQRLRPELIPKPCAEPDNTRICRMAAESDLNVYVDDVLRGKVEALHRYSANDVKEVRRLSGPEATRRFGAQNGAGAIVVTRKQAITPPTSEATG